MSRMGKQIPTYVSVSLEKENRQPNQFSWPNTVYDRISDSRPDLHPLVRFLLFYGSASRNNERPDLLLLNGHHCPLLGPGR